MDSGRRGCPESVGKRQRTLVRATQVHSIARARAALPSSLVEGPPYRSDEQAAPL